MRSNRQHTQPNTGQHTKHNSLLTTLVALSISMSHTSALASQALAAELGEMGSYTATPSAFYEAQESPVKQSQHAQNPAQSNTESDKDSNTKSDDWSDQEWGDDNQDQSPWRISGFTELAYGAFIDDHVTDNAQSISELRVRLDAAYSTDALTVNAKIDALADMLLNDNDYDVRELNIGFSPTAQTDVIAGRQVITWGTGDYLFLNDLFAKDWQSFFAGRDDAYLKAPNDALRVLHYAKSFTLDVVYAPEFHADNYIRGERFSFYSPVEQAVVAPSEFNVLDSDSEQYAMRLAATQNGIEYALYGYKGVWTTPMGSSVEPPFAGYSYFPSLNSYGASMRRPAFGGLFNTEVAVYNSLDDSQGDNPFVANDQIRFLLGYEREVIANTTASVQFYLEHTQDYQALKQAHNQTPMLASTPLIDQNRQVLTLRLTSRAMQQALTTTLFVFYSPTDQDAYIKPSISYRVNDNWQLATGANVFVGEQQVTFFGQHKANSNIWLRARYNF
ncbi:hypothetical protein QWY77_03455 [Thalassotalea ponticola]|uniref:hypothetical protein n=1 Tax=Thalassotalea ponticola TaxID=1523392 RepID=UPI0025B36B87|nr:hypothetical protein [Thalassotalea ponticola]MDN3651822.1 hypothetical protein [Thalassotalea ponticola]